MELVTPVQLQPDLPLTTTAKTTTTTNPFEFDLPTDSNNRLSNPFDFPPSSPSGRLSNPFMDDLSSSSPRRSINPFDLYCHYSSAPSSPNRAAAIYAQINSEENFFARASFSTSSTVPFNWEEKPGTPKFRFADSEGLTSSPEFEFNAPVKENGVPTSDLTTADELFEEGKIRPLKPPPRLQLLAMEENGSMSVGSSPRSSKKSLWSPRQRGKSDFDPFAAALVEATKDRGREVKGGNSNSHARKSSRSLSPLGRGSSLEKKINSAIDSSPTLVPPIPESDSTASSSNSSGKSRKKWRLADLLLFRSASDGRGKGGNRSKDPVFKYSPVTVSPSPAPEKKVKEEDQEKKKHGGLGLKGGHFFIKKGNNNTSEKQVAPDQEGKKKNQLPYKPGVFSCMLLNPSMHRLARGINTYHLSRGK
ncbi:hypothetical protein LUZ60_001242 [Juncus effusus]|nr:hypothetical protein LUZ60_001242 [Juncus effusus]